jgi:polyphosphate kinase 2 (PPK2 family)
MGFSTDEQYERFLALCPSFEREITDDGIILIKYWLHTSDDEQERRFQARNTDPKKRWKLSPMDLTARSRWVDYSRARDVTFEHTSTEWAPWHQPSPQPDPLRGPDTRAARTPRTTSTRRL